MAGRETEQKVIWNLRGGGGIDNRILLYRCFFFLLVVDDERIFCNSRECKWWRFSFGSETTSAPSSWQCQMIVTEFICVPSSFVVVCILKASSQLHQKHSNESHHARTTILLFQITAMSLKWYVYQLKLRNGAQRKKKTPEKAHFLLITSTHFLIVSLSLCNP